ncbi:carbohydrate ABC transporter permease [Streptomyces sp. NBC_00872]|uniref:carbohydrate ABC transporter permease n=1 Tax=Streptomyces sp. NBC_00872 TaxID=2903686 RepID=UPI00386D73B3|nr:sugar ABC transporter permease [Streptomyces sp. NBC_00872]
MTPQMTAAVTGPGSGPRPGSGRADKEKDRDSDTKTSPGRSVARPGLGWTLPAVLFFGLFAIVPLVLVAVLSFTSWSGLGPPEFAGLDNWTALLDDPVMIKSLWLSVLLTGLGVLVQTPLSILLGVWAAGPQRNRAVLSAVFFVPLLLSATAVSVLWRALLDPNFGVPAQARWLFGDGNLLGSRTGAIGVLVLVSAWQFTPLHALIYQGATRAIPEVLYQAAAIDGAGTVRQFFHITLPQLRNSIITSVILMVVGGLTTFDTVLILTQGGPGTDTAITAYYMYQKAFKGFDFGAGAAIALLLVVVATLISLAVVRISGYDKMAGTKDGL